MAGPTADPAVAATSANTAPAEFPAWLVHREISDQPTLALAFGLFEEAGWPADQVRHWRERGRVFALTDPAAPPTECVAAAVIFVPLSDDTLELSAMAVAPGWHDQGLSLRLLRRVSPTLEALGVTRIVARSTLGGPHAAAHLHGVKLRPTASSRGDDENWLELDLAVH